MGLIIWSLVCLTIYVALRWLRNRAPEAIAMVGWFVFVVQAIVVGTFVLLLLSFEGMPSLEPNTPQPVVSDTVFVVQFTLGVFALWLAPLFVGAFLTRAAAHKQGSWGAHLLFCAAFVGLSGGVSWFILARLRLSNSLMQSWSDLFNWVPSGTALFLWWQAVSLLLLWAFPLGAPVAEIIVNSFKRAHKTNKTGSLL